jgi:hypothetical protein
LRILYCQTVSGHDENFITVLPELVPKGVDANGALLAERY